MSVNLLTAPIIAPLDVPADSELLPDGNAILDGILVDMNVAAAKALKRQTGSTGSFVEYRPAGWTMGGRVD